VRALHWCGTGSRHIVVTGGVLIMSASLQVNSATALTTVWKLHLYSVTPPSALADNDLFDVPAGDQGSYLGFIDIAQLTDVGSTLYIQSDNLNKAIRPAARSVFGYLVARDHTAAVAYRHLHTLADNGYAAVPGVGSRSP
jgi:hypothetical protein